VIPNVDVTSIDNVKHAHTTVKQMIEEGDIIDCIVFSAAQLFMDDKVSQINPTQLTSAFNTKVGGALNVVNVFEQDVVSAKGSIILVNGAAGVTLYYHKLTSVGICNAGLRVLAKSLASELNPASVRVTSVEISGWVKDGNGVYDPLNIGKTIYELANDNDANNWKDEVIIAE
jgi:NADP-dependent 3-hydroxy acid dehydrogenase YdfG